MEENVCEICKAKYSNFGNLNKHYKNVHKREPLTPRPRRINEYMAKCLNGCEISFRSISHLITHLRTAHSEEICVKNLLFSTAEDFEQWRQEEELKNCSQYIMARGTKIKEKEKIVYLMCSRSGRSCYFKNKILPPGKKRKLKLKAQGYSKMENFCTSYMTVKTKVASPNIHVEYCDYHYGHSRDVEHLRIPHKARLQIAEKLMQGVPRARILEDIQESLGDTDMSRTDMITMRDLNNIISSYNLSIGDQERELIAISEELEQTDMVENSETYDSSSLITLVENADRSGGIQQFIKQERIGSASSDVEDSEDPFEQTFVTWEELNS